MNYDELLIEVNRRLQVSLYSGDPQSVHALRAVVELHKVLLVKNYEDDTDWYSCQACGGTKYPCESIEAIEKELT